MYTPLMVNKTPLQVKVLKSRAAFARMVGVSPAAVTKACKTLLLPATEGKRIDVAHPAAVEYMKHNTASATNSPATGLDPLYAEAVTYCQSIKRISTSAIQREFNIGYVRAKRITDTMNVNKVVIDMLAAPAPPPPEKAPPPPAAIATPIGSRAKNHTKKTAALENLNNSIEQGTTLHTIPDDIKSFVDMTLREIIHRFGTDTAFLDWLNATKRIEDINEKRLKNAEKRGELVNRNLIKVGVIEPFDTVFNKMLTDGAKTIARRVHAMAGAGRPVEDCEAFIADQLSSFIEPAKAKITRTLKNA